MIRVPYCNMLLSFIGAYLLLNIVLQYVLHAQTVNLSFQSINKFLGFSVSL